MAIGNIASSSASIYSTVCAKEISEFILNTDLKIINSDNNITILNEVKKLNQSLNINNLYVTEKTNTSAKIIASSSSDYKTESSVVVNFINQRHLNWTPDLLKNRGNNYYKWNEEFNRQKKKMYRIFPKPKKELEKMTKIFKLELNFIHYFKTSLQFKIIFI
ncbi:hypothetical protein [Spiroplasma endosymbiont of Agriotes lineatus]|uniref:hypothetical protein n=1 Tax=Spiroplasma endosymbiont of Agriotes lineatus TaxID=3077930 RepID=UPI0030D57D84